MKCRSGCQQRLKMLKLITDDMKKPSLSGRQVSACFHCPIF
jgi:hypothetical protein